MLMLTYVGVEKQDSCIVEGTHWQTEINNDKTHPGYWTRVIIYVGF